MLVHYPRPRPLDRDSAIPLSCSVVPGGTAAKQMTKRACLAAASLGVLPVLLPGCSTPSTTLRSPRTGQVVTCGGNVSSSLAGGYVGYSMQRSSDQRCVAEYSRLGFVPVR